MAFKPQEHLTNIKGKDYLEVKWRLVWFREDNPDGKIITEVVNYEPPVVKASVYIKESMIATGHAQAVADQRTVWTNREIEKAETAAIGRALAHAGYGTQFTGEDEGENMADSPVEKKADPKPKEPKVERPYPAMVLKQKVADFAKVYRNKQERATETDRKIVAAALDTIFDKDSTKRYELCGWLVGEQSTKNMGSEYILALKTWLGAESFGSEPNPHAQVEAQRGLAVATKEAKVKELL